MGSLFNTKMKFNINVNKDSLQPKTLKQVDKALRPHATFWFIIKAIAFLGLLFSIPVWIWFGWELFWKLVLTCIFVYFPANFIHTGYIETKHAWIKALKENNMLLEENTEKNEIKRKNDKKN